MSRILLVLFAVAWALFGIACLISPSSMLTGFGIALSGADAVTEARAMYGGAQLGLAAFLAYAARRETYFRAALLLVGLIMGGIAVARLIGVIVDGSTLVVTIGSLATELLVSGVALFAFTRQPVPKAAA
jgi:hypothetical protein